MNHELTQNNTRSLILLFCLAHIYNMVQEAPGRMADGHCFHWDTTSTNEANLRPKWRRRHLRDQSFDHFSN